MKKLRAGIVVAVLISIAACVVVWILTYPSARGPKSIKYVLWKHGLYGMDLDTASGTMIGDANREMLVLGKTKVELREKFGYLSTLPEGSPYLRSCYENSDWKGTDVLFIRKSPWMIVCSGDRATKLILSKGDELAPEIEEEYKSRRPSPVPEPAILRTLQIAKFSLVLSACMSSCL